MLGNLHISRTGREVFVAVGRGEFDCKGGAVTCKTEAAAKALETRWRNAPWLAEQWAKRQHDAAMRNADRLFGEVVG